MELFRCACLWSSRSDGRQGLAAPALTELTAQQERNEAKPWAPSDAPRVYIEAMLHSIIGFRFAITRLEGKWKMSQNREMQDRDGVAKGLGKRANGRRSRNGRDRIASRAEQVTDRRCDFAVGCIARHRANLRGKLERSIA